MSVRRLHETQPDSFAFSPENVSWAEGQIAKYPEGRQASAIIPLLWQAQKQAGGCCLLYTSPSPRDLSTSRMPSSA